MSSKGKIVDEAGYQKSLEWMVLKAAELDDPLLEPAERAKLQKTYNFVEQRLREYRRGELVLKYPDLRRIFAELGEVVQELEPQQNAPEPVSEPPKPPAANTPDKPDKPAVKPADVPAAKPKANLSSWLDD